jgi:phosphoribosylaminoimidazole-succinocarboxamide synthase
VTTALSQVSVDLPRVASGKVREVFDAGPHLLMVATDRISVYDVVLPTPIPDKGAVLNGLSVFWFDFTKDIVPNHLVEWRGLPYEDARGRGMLVRRAEMLPIECAVRGYLFGSSWKDYQKTGSVCGVELPKGMREADRLDAPIFTPATKAVTGHDENIDFDAAASLVGDRALVERVREVSIELFEAASRHAETAGIILCDTKFEFGLVDGELTLCDEVFTPDSSRFWPADSWTPGTAPPSFDKQYVRDYSDSIGWDHTYPGPELPDDVVAGTTRRYREAYELIAGRPLDDFLAEA